MVIDEYLNPLNICKTKYFFTIIQFLCKKEHLSLVNRRKNREIIT